jgi:hypothetical protein
MAKNDPEARSKSSLSDCTWLESEYGSFNLGALKFLMHFREPGSSLYFYFTHTHIFFFFLYYSFFLFFFFSFFLFLLFFLSHKKFYLLPFEL